MGSDMSELTDNGPRWVVVKAYPRGTKNDITLCESEGEAKNVAERLCNADDQPYYVAQLKWYVQRPHVMTPPIEWEELDESGC